MSDKKDKLGQSLTNAGQVTGAASQAGGSAFKRPDANASWFTLKVGDSEMAVYAFEGVEEVSKLFAFSVEVVSTDNAFVLRNVLGRQALLSIKDRSNGTRLVHGIVREAEQLHTSNTYTHYRYEIAPKLYFLGLNQDHRIFQNLSIVDIIKKLFTEQGFAGDTYEFRLRNTYAPREYCLQYGESDLHFISRIAEEEGVYFYFEHKDDNHVLIFADAAGGPPIPQPNPLRFFAGSGQVADRAVIARLNMHEKISSDRASYRDWDFQKPTQDLLVTQNETSDEKAPVHGGINYDRYQYPHLYQDKGEGERYANIQLLRQLTWHTWVNGETDVSRLTPGFTFTLQEHGRMDLNRDWQVISVIHKGEQPQVLQQEAPSERGMFYNATFKAIPSDIRFVPEVVHKKTLVVGNQTAIVTGPKGEEIYPDKHGRVKVQLFWDREGKWDEKTTCWIRVSQGWAGGQYGTMAIPRIGHEVIVSFLEGNPDRPIITGRVYHGINTPPYELPAHKTRTVFKSLSSPGGGGFNELRIEDKKGQEEIYMHAQKDVDIYVKNNWRELIGHDTHREVKNNTYLITEGETHETFKGVKKAEHHASVHETIKGDSQIHIENMFLVKADEEIHFKSGLKGVIECGTELTLKASGGFIKIDPSGVTIVGRTIRLNSGGSPGTGSGANPEKPDLSDKVGASKTPVYSPVYYNNRQFEAMEKAANDHSIFCSVCEGE